MSEPLPASLDELHDMLATLDAELSRSRVLLGHLPMAVRPDTIAGYSRRLEQLEALGRLIGLRVGEGQGPKPR